MKAHTIERFALATVLFTLAVSASAQVTAIPQIADGGGWQTTFVITNTNATNANISLNFFQETTAGATQSWSLPLLETSNTQNMTLAGGGTLFLDTPGTAPTTTQGWAQVQADPGVTAYAVFTELVPGRQNQQGTSTAMTSSPRILIPFNDTNGLVTSIAIANSDSSTATIYVLIQTDAGVITTPAPLILPAQGHAAFTVPQQFPGTAGARGLIELYPLTGNFSALALLFNPTGSFTTAPAYPQTTETPIIGAGSYNGGPTGGGYTYTY